MVDGKTSCAFCHSRDAFHWEVGCPALASCDLVCSEDKVGAKAILAKFDVHRPRPGRGGAGRGGRGDSGRGGSGRGASGRGGDASGRRATSSERLAVTQPAPTHVPPAPPGPPPNPATHYSAYPDTNGIPSDSDNDAAFDLNYGNNVDSSGGSVPAGNSSIKQDSG